MRQDAALQVVVQCAAHRRAGLALVSASREGKGLQMVGNDVMSTVVLDPMAHTRVVKPPDVASWWSLCILVAYMPVIRARSH